jgi:hypothetical protein
VDHYKGVPLTDLTIDAVHWSEERIEHIRTRSLRKGPEDLDVEPEWATEAALDPRRLVRLAAVAADPAAQSLVVIGWSPGVPPAGAILKVWIWSDEPRRSGTWNGGSAAKASGTDRRRYEEQGGG